MFLAGCNKQQQKPLLPSLNETYRKDDKKPFGGYVAHNIFKKWFDDRYMDANKKPFDEAWLDMKDYSTNTEHSLYILLTKNLEVNESEVGAMVSFVEAGNDMFIAADYIDSNLLVKIKCQTERLGEIISEVAGKMKETSVKTDDRNDITPPYQYYFYPFLNSFSGYDSGYTKVLGFNEIKEPNYIILFLGKGRLYLNAAPRAFSNYFLLSKNNVQYLKNVLSYIRPEPKNIFWDEYYKNKTFSKRKKTRGNSDKQKNDFSPFNVINKNPPLLWAFWLAVTALLVYILSNIKRKQRIINEVKPNINTTVTFTETVGRLYLQKKNNKNISEKMITYFYEHIRNKYFLNMNQVNKAFINTLSAKSGVPIDVTQKLFATIEQVQAEENVSDMELLSFNELIQNFYKNKT